MTSSFASAKEAETPVYDFHVTTQVFPQGAFETLGIGKREGIEGEVKQFLSERKTFPRKQKIPLVIKTFTKGGFLANLSGILRESYASRILNDHPNIVKCYDLFILEDVVQIPPERPSTKQTVVSTAPVALTFPSACVSLRDFWKDKGITSRETVSRLCQIPTSRAKAALIPAIMYQLLRAIAYCHEAGILHRDIKPENILVFTEKENVPLIQLADFGRALFFYSNDPQVTYVTKGIFTHQYRAPELIREFLRNADFFHYTGAVDVWAVGIVFYELLFPKQFPFDLAKFQYSKSHEKEYFQRLYKTMTDKYFKGNEFRSEFRAHLLQKLVKVAKMTPGEAEPTAQLLLNLLAPNAQQRIQARKALEHPYFLRHKAIIAEVKEAYPVIPTTRDNVSACGMGWLLFHQTVRLYPRFLSSNSLSGPVLDLVKLALYPASNSLIASCILTWLWNSLMTSSRIPLSSSWMRNI